MTLAAGTKLGPYEILSPLGAGGMGDFGLWLADGLRIAYRQPPENKVFATDLEFRGDTLSVGETRQVLGGKSLPPFWGDVSRDGNSRRASRS